MKFIQHITLDNLEIEIVNLVGRSRHANARSIGITDKQMGNQEVIAIDIDGFGAEYAFCKAINVMPVISLLDQDQLRGSIDCVLPSGLTVDVKQTCYKHGRLLAVPHKKEAGTADIYVLMIGKVPSYRFAGWTYGKLLIRDEMLTDLGHGTTYCMKQDMLYPLESIPLRQPF